METSKPRAPRLVWLMGPALVAGVAYLDPGNVASNMTAGAKYGYLLVWVVVLGNLMAWLIQYFSAKLGIVTGQSLPEVLGNRIRNDWTRRAYWIQAEVVAMATDIAEIIGGAVALNLLFGLPLLAGGIVTGVISMALLLLHSRFGSRPFEFVIVALVLIICVGFTVGVFIVPPDAAATTTGLLPRFSDTDSVLLAASILGATVMPHAIYAHSSLTRDRFSQKQLARSGLKRAMQGEFEPRSLSIRRLIGATRLDVTVAMAVAGTVNLCILLFAASALAGIDGTDRLEGAYAAIAATLGGVAATLFAVGLLASGLASTAVGAYAGAEIMQGLLKIRIPLIIRRVVTLIPALILLGLGFDPTMALVLSQVLLSFGIPFALVPLVVFTARTSILGEWKNRWWTTTLGAIASVILIVLNIVLLTLVFAGV